MIATISSPVKQADVHIGASMAYYDMGEIEKGLEHARIGAERAMSANGLECACAAYFGIGRGELDRRNLDDALAQFRRSLTLADKVGMDYYINLIRAGVAEAEFEKGTVGSVEKIGLAIENARSTDDDFVVAALAMPYARALLRLERASEARAPLEAAIAYFRRMDLKPYLANALGILGDIAEALGETDQAAEAREEAAGLRDEIRLPPPVAAQMPTLQA
jgi:tetratricopeptide (TPR) repeat protein